MRKKRAGALILKDKKLLLVTNDEADFYWTPGGRLEEGEDYLQCLARELDEELGITAKSVKFFKDIAHEVVDCRYYIVEPEGELIPNNEVSDLLWYSREDFESGKINVSPRITEQIYPELIKAKLV